MWFRTSNHWFSWPITDRFRRATVSCPVRVQFVFVIDTLGRPEMEDVVVQGVAVTD
jgi:hypothetical protein